MKDFVMTIESDLLHLKSLKKKLSEAKKALAEVWQQMLWANQELKKVGGIAHGDPKVNKIDGKTYYQEFSATEKRYPTEPENGPGFGVWRFNDVHYSNRPGPLNTELGDKCMEIHTLWRERAIAYNAAQDEFSNAFKGVVEKDEEE